jgi:hypothetical protein
MKSILPEHLLAVILVEHHKMELFKRICVREEDFVFTSIRLILN